MAQIPEDLLFYIASFIPDDELRRMLDVSSVFFNISMGIRYRDVSLGKTDDPHESKLLVRLAQDEIGTRVRSLRLEIRLPTATEGNENDRQQQIDSAGETLVKALNAFTKLTSFAIKWLQADTAYTGEVVRKVLPSGWSAFGKTLRRLEISAPIVQLPNLRLDLVPPQCSLEHLELRFQSSASITESAIPLALEAVKFSELSNLITVSNASLQYLRLNIFTHFNLPNVQEILPTSPNTVFSKLKRIEIQINWKDRALSSKIFQFLSQSQVSLSTLHLGSVPSVHDLNLGAYLATWVETSLQADATIFSNIKLLTVGAPSRGDAGWAQLVPLLRRASPSLEELDILERGLSPSEVRDLSDIFQSSQSLKVLRIFVTFVSPQIFKELSKISSLEDLTISYVMFSDDKNGRSKTAFTVAMENYMFPNWRLRKLTVGRARDLNLRERALESNIGIVSTLLRCVPSVRHFDGESGVSILGTYTPKIHRLVMQLG